MTMTNRVGRNGTVIGESIAPEAIVLLKYPPEHDYKPDG